MTIEYINTGTIANDGTGDDLREAFIKINNNFEELDLRIVEETVIENTGTLGQGTYAGKTDGIHGFKRLVEGTNVTLTSTDTSITINADDSIADLLIGTDNGILTVTPVGNQFNIRGTTGIVTNLNGTEIEVSLDNIGIVVADTAPILGGNLNANNKNISGANTITAATFNGYLQGLVYGYDVREFGPYLSGFDFGTVRNTYNNALEFILATVDLDFGAITPDSGDTVDLGYIV